MSAPLPATDRYAAPSLDCDVVMKGGITSGVIYPLAVCRLAERYRLRDIGGASAGAIAATAAGAAEFGRQQGSASPLAGFAGLERLPAQLAEPVGPAGTPRLMSLFQPSEATRPFFKILLAILEGPTLAARVTGGLKIILEHNGASCWVALVIAIGLAYAGFSGETGALGWVAIAAGALAVLAVGLAVAVVRFVLAGLGALGPINNFGLCPGQGAPSSTPPLTVWLAGLLDDLAGNTGPDPITFGDLRRKEIGVSVMTTELTRMRPLRLPFEEADFGAFFFRRSDFERLFPPSIVDFMVRRVTERLQDPRFEALRTRLALINGGGEEALHPFPDADSLPLVVAARMSLSFPVLLQAVPLYAVDWTLRANKPVPRPERCWFSDGGICSNLPIHFFDALLPSRPTFALDLTAPHPDHPVQFPPFGAGKSERDNVWMATSNIGGIAATWARFDRPGRRFPLFSFLSAIIDTMQSWNDQLTSHYPGYRDRIVHISHTADEGGLNLDMKDQVITRLSARGAAAGEVLRERFDPATGPGWANHQWIRYRSLLAMLEDQAPALTRSLRPATGPVDPLLQDSPSYPFTHAQDQVARHANGILRDLAATLTDGPPLSADAPHPRAELKGRPRSA
jgi:predicted acylesterase/phospholipase RssA